MPQKPIDLAAVYLGPAPIIEYIDCDPPFHIPGLNFGIDNALFGWGRRHWMPAAPRPIEAAVLPHQAGARVTVTTPVALVSVPVKSMPIAVPAGISRSLAVVESVRAWMVSAVPLRL